MSFAKIKSFEDLVEIVKKNKKQNKTIVHCHGCFDLVHPGHIKHFQAASELGDVLIVTITQDKYINKGPDRPVFKEKLRSETIASIECVDFVAINKWPSAVETIQALRPDFYVKDQEFKEDQYKEGTAIFEEREIVESFGGKLHLTEEIRFSSSKLLKDHFGVESNKDDIPFLKRINEFYQLLERTEVYFNSPSVRKKCSFAYAIEGIFSKMDFARKIGGTIFLVGNGGSSAIASHMAVDFIKACGIKSEVFTDASLMTCMGNDFGYEEVYAWPISQKIKKVDILIAISSSGQSENILRAVEEAKKKGAFVVTLSGFKTNNPLRTSGDYNFYVPSDSYRLVESAHDFIIHQYLVDFYLEHLGE